MHVIHCLLMASLLMDIDSSGALRVFFNFALSSVGVLRRNPGRGMALFFSPSSFIITFRLCILAEFGLEKFLEMRNESRMIDP